jgi:hypothetical protein
MACAAPAQAAETVLPVDRNGVATCARDAGGGQVTLQAAATRTSSPTDLLSASPEQVERAAGTDLGRLVNCPEAASGGGVTVIAGFAQDEDPSRGLVLRAAVRGDLEGFEAPVTLGRVPHYDVAAPAVAVGPRGDAVIAWKQFRGEPIDEDRSVRILAARRPAAPGARFGTVEEVVGWTRQEDFIDGASDVAAGVDGNGRATIAWAVPAPPEARVSDLSAIGVSTGAPGEPLRPVRVRRTLQDLGRLSLSVAPDGAALLATTGQEQAHVFERPAGSDGFTAREPLGSEAQTADEAAVALGGDGAAIVAWRWIAYTADPRRQREGIAVVRRPAGGQYSAPAVVWSQTIRDESGATATVVDETAPPLDQPRVRASVAADGRSAITWIAPRRTGLDQLPAGWTAAAAADAGFTVARVGSPCRPVNGVTPARAPDGLTTAWTDNAAHRIDDRLEFPLEGGRLHVADSPPSPLPTAAAPKLTLTRTRATQRIWSDDPMTVEARCDGPCDLRVFVPGRGTPLTASGTVLREAGRKKVPIYTSLSPLVGFKRRDVPVVVHACSPDGTSRARATTTVRAVRNRPPPVPTPVGVSARRSGDEIVVAWHTPFAARRTDFNLIGLTGRSLRSSDFATDHGSIPGKARRRFRVRLRELPGRRARFVRIDAYSTEYRGGAEHVTVPVR